MSLLRRLLSLPALLAYQATDRRDLIDADVKRWAEVEGREHRMPGTLIELFSQLPEFRSLFYHRVYHGNKGGRLTARAVLLFLPGKEALYLSLDVIGPGFYIQHGFSTVIDAEYIGANVWINQQVTIGFSKKRDGTIGKPRIEDGATIFAGAKVVGDVRVGKNAVVGANAVVIKDVPDGMLAVGVPAVNREMDGTPSGD